MEQQEGAALTLRARPKRMPSLNLPSCFQSRSSDYHAFKSSPSTTSTLPSTAPPSPPHFLSPSSWFRSSNNNVSSPVLRKNSFRRRRHSADFSYDPHSYSLNFDEGRDIEFSVRSPAALPRRRLRDLDLPHGGVRPPLIREGDKDDDLHVPEMDVSAEAETTQEISVTLL